MPQFYLEPKIYPSIRCCPNCGNQSGVRYVHVGSLRVPLNPHRLKLSEQDLVPQCQGCYKWFEWAIPPTSNQTEMVKCWNSHSAKFLVSKL